LVELLVVVAIIGILLSLMLPAVQSSREAARASMCRSHVKQLGLAFHMHNSAHKYFPTGGWDWYYAPTYRGDATPRTGEEQKAGWGFQILPYIEGNTTYAAGAEVAIGTPHPLFFCPTRRSPQTWTLEDNYRPPLTGETVTRAMCDYAASNREETGMVRRRYPVRLRHVTDGTSNTLLVGEKRMNVGRLGGPQDDDNEGYTVGWNEDTIRRTERLPEPDHRGTEDGEKLFGASHPGSWNAVFADGSVHSISYSIDLNVFICLGDKSDGEILKLPDF